MIENTASKKGSFSSQEKNSSKIKAAPAPNDRYVREAPSKIKNIIVSGHDRIVVVEETGANKYYVIEKIYKLKGREQAEKIKKRLRRTRRRRTGLYI